ncbi:nicotinate-nucleotide adenylyltransferase [Mobiluncus mulieris]|uniref:Probable nicotinate-nucleotide adenylyltransferase n=2 Tax=Mobiluncus mulieris TaxID=2052 RepID=E0QQ54_9ACTO|nr:nicotinate-nucleotide adenylyltransferase [Mobiluncus mulieris]EEZ91866.1 nicotinate-nucleotide adenylyltransferase [Mobiluncus mulieris 28-1]EFM46434.1 nicotinate-nucleotide adenylyltransferase [Mobiluncus mulieris ATCC 35239]EFN92304.1 nicotinate-nucleotide adenylyltransferase [Mobiluncus mulieris FB024-16]MBB5846580.1 nicotinate-nucleotide adenylyltransferase [Mobiluncus mulieris]MCU9968428.1 nicotinate-nucleotide adenylyltransferase [Mobiluncus mulieris]
METRHDAGLWSGSRHRVRRIGVMGGTFDPIHHGHLVAASEVQAVFGLDEVIFVPTFMQPFKLGRAVTPAEHRYLMVVIATASNPKFSVSRVDIERGTTTYTIDTLRDLHGIYQNSELFFITGADAIADIMKWKDVDKLFELAHFVGVTRPGVVFDSGSLPAQRVSLVEVPAMAISSTDCRSRVKSHQPVWYLVPDGVVQYIAKYGLYQDSDFLVSSAKTAEDCENAGILKFREEAPK